MATDRDTLGRRLDKRFRPVAGAIRNRAVDAVERICGYIVGRDREADRDDVLIGMFSKAHRVLTHPAAPLFADMDPEVKAIAALGRTSEAATRLARAFEDCLAHGAELAAELARHQARWLQGRLAIESEWADLRAIFPEYESEVIVELARRHRKRFLGIGEAPPKRTAVTQAELLGQEIAVRL